MLCLGLWPHDIPDLLMLVDILRSTTPEEVEETTVSVFGNEALPERPIGAIATLFTSQHSQHLG